MTKQLRVSELREKWHEAAAIEQERDPAVALAYKRCAADLRDALKRADDDIARGMTEPIEQHRCQHLRQGTLPKHSTLRLWTVPEDENTTGANYRFEVELCTYCSGFSAAKVLALMQGEQLRAVGESYFPAPE